MPRDTTMFAHLRRNWTRFQTPTRAAGRRKAYSIRLGFLHLEDRVTPTAGVQSWSVSTEPQVVTNTLGWEFAADMPITVTSLGVWDDGNDGLRDAHAVGIWTSNASQTLLVSTTVPSGTSAPSDAGYRYVDLTQPITLAAGSYVIGAFFGSDPIVGMRCSSG